MTGETTRAAPRPSGAGRRARPTVIGPRAGRGALALLVAGATLLGACATVTTAGGCGIQPGSVCPGTYMKGAKLPEANLYGANLDRSDLRGAELAGANLGGAQLDHTDLARADLRHAHLEDANLDGADLRGAQLDGAWLQGATFLGALGVTVDELEGATVCRTVFAPGVVLSRDC